MNKNSLLSFVRSGGWAWPGGYPCALLMRDGECIDAQSARDNYRQIRTAMRSGPDYDHAWEPVEVFIHWEGEPLYCAHSNRIIESAYGVPDA